MGAGLRSLHRSPTPTPTIQRCCTSPAARQHNRRAQLHVHGAAAMHYVTGLYALDLHADDINWCKPPIPDGSRNVVRRHRAPLLHGVTSGGRRGGLRRAALVPHPRRPGCDGVVQPHPPPLRMLIKAGPELAAAQSLSACASWPAWGEPLNAEAVWWGERVLGLPNPRQLVADRDRRHHDRQHPGLRVKPGSMGRRCPEWTPAWSDRHDDGTISSSTNPTSRGNLR